MTKYEIIDKVSRFVKRFGMIMDPETMNKARDEAGEYDFRLISKGHYAVQHKKKMYVIIERDGEIGCSCDDMTYNRMDGSVCKHIIAFSRMLTPVVKEIEEGDRGFLVNACGWTGKDLHPEIELGGPGAVVQEDTTPAPEEPEGKIYTRRCQHCDEVFSGMDLDAVKKELADHLKVCGMNPRAKPHKQTSEEVKKMEDKPAWDQEMWNNATQGSFASYGEDGVAVVLFTANDFEISTKPDKWGRNAYEFAVIQNNKAVVLSVGSIRLMSALKEILPLEGKRIKISRSGEGTGTKYEVQDVTDTEVI